MSIHIVVENVASVAADAAAQRVHDDMVEAGADPERAVTEALELYGRIYTAVEHELEEAR